MYVLVRKDLSKEQIAVQAAHAAIESTRRFLPGDLEHPHLILCGIDNEVSLLKEQERLTQEGISSIIFYEEDRDGEATALATEVVYGETRKNFRQYKLLKL